MWPVKSPAHPGGLSDWIQLHYGDRMSASRLAVAASIVSLVAWALKAVTIGMAGGLDRSPLEGPLFLVGLVAILVALAALGVSVAGDRSVGMKVLGGVVGVVLGFPLSMVASMLAEAVVPDSAGWVQAEAGLWASAVLAVVLTLWWRARGAARVAA